MEKEFKVEVKTVCPRCKEEVEIQENKTFCKNEECDSRPY